MTLPARARPVTAGAWSSPVDLEESFEALIFDWEGTAVADGSSDAAPLRHRLEELSTRGVHVFVVGDVEVEAIEGQLGARPRGPGALHLCGDHGSEISEITSAGRRTVWRRPVGPEEDRALDGAVDQTVERLASLGLGARATTIRPHRRRIDLTLLPPGAEQPETDRSAPAEATAALARLGRAGITGRRRLVDLATEAAHGAGLSDPRITGDPAWVEIGLTDTSDAAGFAAAWLAARGVTGGLILLGGDDFGTVGGVAGPDSSLMIDALSRAVVVSVGTEPGGVPDGVIHLGGGPARFSELLDTQLTRRRRRRVPAVDLDPAWVVPLPDAPTDERVAESLATLGNGRAATRGTREEDDPDASPLFLVSGVYTADNSLLPGPTWTSLELTGGGDRHLGRRFLDLRTGVLVRRDDGDAGLRSVRLVSAAMPHALALRAEGPRGRLAAGPPLRAPRATGKLEETRRGDVHLARTGTHGAGITVAARDQVEEAAGRCVVERLAGWVADADGATVDDDACARLGEAEALGFDRLLAEHRQAWARRWRDAEVVIEGDAESELAARFAVFHLLSAAGDADEVGIGARGLTGGAYAGHVFWDADVFVLPALAAIDPAGARAMLEYRIRRLPAARAAARARGLDGARFPWESARSGEDVTPHWVQGPHGVHVPVGTASHEEHVVADVAWAAVRYADWTGDASLLAGPGRDLVVETARYWARRVRRDPDGRGHLYGVMGPDEYHEVVDDNAYTNVMARWNLRRGADLLENTGGEPDEAGHWRQLADDLVDGWNPERGIYEQFAGYFGLETLLMADVAPPPATADAVLGPERVRQSQLIKQADVLMLHHLVPEEVVAGSLGPCLAYYEPRTAHGSSLSPAISASLLARAGEPDRALALFRMAARIDLDDLTRTTAGGLHLAAMGGVWQALARGFLGLRADGGTLVVDPHLPTSWRALGLTFRFGGHGVGVRAEHGRLMITCDAPLVVRVAGRAPRRCEPPGAVMTMAPAATTGVTRDPLGPPGPPAGAGP